MMGTCIRIRFIMSPSISNRALRGRLREGAESYAKVSAIGIRR